MFIEIVIEFLFYFIGLMWTLCGLK